MPVARPVFFALLLALGFGGCKRQESAVPSPAAEKSSSDLSDQFLSLMNAGKGFMDQGDATNALATYEKALKLQPSDADLHLNLANAHLLAGNAPEAIREAGEALKTEPNSAAAFFVKGSALLRLSNAEEASKAFQNANILEPGVPATLFQLGLARMGLKQWDEAIAAFREGLSLDPNHLHAPVHYLLAQALLRAGRHAEAEQELQQHQLSADGSGAGQGVATFERCKYTQARVPFKLDQPERDGIPVKYVDVTPQVLGNGSKYAAPVGIVDVNHTGWNHLFVTEKGGGFRLLTNRNGTFVPAEPLYPAGQSNHFTKVLAGDLQNDRVEDVIILGREGSRLFQFTTNGTAVDLSEQSGIASLRATDGLLMDLDFTGKLDLIAAGGPPGELRVLRQFGPFRFSDVTRTSGIPAGIRFDSVLMEDWNRDDHMDLISTRPDRFPLLLEKQRGGPVIPREMTNWVHGEVICSGDFNNDLRPDLAVAGNGKITVCFNTGERTEIPTGSTARKLLAIDYDNDGWLDLWSIGDRVRAWRNLGAAGFREETASLGLDQLNLAGVAELHFADLDNDCDSDVVLALENGGLRCLRNEGGNANYQAKVQLIGNRSNATGLGCKVEISAGGLRLIRTVTQLPVEVGVGKHSLLDSFLVHWFNWPQGAVEVPVTCTEPLLSLEQTIQEGSCPYLYAWDGTHFRFVTDILGAAPLGLPVAPGVFVEADPDELVWIGDDTSFVAKNGRFEVRITEELREVLYLDQAHLLVVDRPSDTQVHPTDKLLPRGPFPAGKLWTLSNEHPLLRAETLEGTDVTALLKRVDERRVSPPKLRSPQLRGLAEPHGVVLDFGPLNTSDPLVLVMNGWLRFGGGMANIAAAHDASLPFPFPQLEMEVAPGEWKSVAVTVGAPAGKTKTILVDLSGKLVQGARRLRLTQAFEIHWDRIALMERSADLKASSISPAAAELRYRGFSRLRDLPSDFPLTPEYDVVSDSSPWTIVPGGWCTRYGDVLELVHQRDEGLVLLNSGDELRLTFDAATLPAKSPGTVREFFLYVDGWDKDSDFHVAAGTNVGPLPFHGMDSQNYGQQKRPVFASDRLHQKYNTRWVEGRTLRRVAKR